MYHITPNSQPTPAPTPQPTPAPTPQPITKLLPLAITNNFNNFTDKLIPIILDDCATCIQTKTCNTDTCKDCPWCAYCLNYPTADICLNSDLPNYSSNVTENETTPPCYFIPRRLPECPDENGVGCEDLNNVPWVCQENMRNYDSTNPTIFPTCLGGCVNEFSCRYESCASQASDDAPGGNCVGIPCNQWFWPTKCPDSTDTARWITLDYGTSCCGCHLIMCDCSGVDCTGGICQGVDGGGGGGGGGGGSNLPVLTGITPTRGTEYTSTPITITGTNLTGTTRVKIGQYDATNVVVVNNATVTANTPVLSLAESGGLVSVSIITLEGESNAVSFRYTRPLPIITQVEPNEGPTTGYTVVTIRGTNLFDPNDPEETFITFGGVLVSEQPPNVERGNALSYISGLDNGGIDEITVWTPAGSAGLKNIRITTSAGTTTLPDAYNYIQQYCSYGVKSWPYNSAFIQPPNTQYGIVMVSVARSSVGQFQLNKGHAVALKNDGTVIGWGYGAPSLGTRSDGTFINTFAAGQYLQILGQKLTGIVAVSAQLDRIAVLKSDGTVVVLGNNGFGECLGTNTDKEAITTIGNGAPVKINGNVLTGVTAIAGGAYHTVALRNGEVLVWGGGTIGTPDFTNYGNAIVPNSAKSGVTAIATGRHHTLALKDGAVLAWGDNYYGQCTVPDSAKSGVTAIAGSYYHSVALKTDGTVVAWGYNFRGECLGTDINGNAITSTPTGQPVQIMGQVLTGVTAIACAAEHTIALKNGGIVAWGARSQDSVPLEAASGVFAIASSEGDIGSVYLDRNTECPPPPFCSPPFVLQQNGTDPSCGCTIWQCVYDGISDCPNGQHFVVIGTDDQGQDIGQCQNDCGICTPPPVCTGPDSILVPIRTDECGCITYECVDGFAFEGNADIKTNTIAPTSGKEIVFNSQVLGKDATSPFNFVTKRQVPGIGSGFASQQYTDTADALNNKKINTYIKDQDTSWLNAAKTYANTADINQNNSLPNYTELERQIRASLYFTRKWNKNNTEKSTTDGSSLEEMATTSYENEELQRLAAEQNGIYKNISAREMQVNVALKGTSINTVSSTTVTETFSNTEMFRNSSSNTYGQLDIPVGVTSSGGVDNPINPFWSTISPGESQQAAVKDGTVYAWGRSNDGARVGAGMTGVVSVHAGSRMTIALKDDGTVVGWGDNNTLCLGTTDGGSLITLPTRALGKQKVKILGVELADVAQVTVGQSHVAALKNDGSVVVWGSNGLGQTAIPFAASENVSAISCGNYHTLALKDGTVIGWGTNTNGQCFGSTNVGTAITTTQPAGTPVKILGQNLTDVAAIAGGYSHSVALKTDGTVIAWGLNSSGQCLGTVAGGVAITTTTTGAPVKINNYVLTGVSAIAAGNYHSLALKDGTVVAWGSNSDGQCTVPENAKYNVTHIAAGYNQSMARKLDGTVVSWGDNDYGQKDNDIDLVNGVTTPSNPSWSAIANGNYWNAVLKAGQVYAWGIDVINSTSTKVVNYIPTSAKSGVVAISGVNAHILGLKDNGTVVGWGSNITYGQSLGTTVGGAAILSTPTIAGATVKIEGTELTGVTAVAAGYYHSLALQSSGTVVAWGAGMVNTGSSPYYGQSIVPAAAQSNIISVAAGINHSLAVKDNGTVVAWGNNSSGQCLGSTAGGAAITNTPTGVTVLLNGTELTGVTAVAGSTNHSLALKTDGTVVGWGSNSNGNCLGTNSNGSPITTTSLTGGFVKIGGIGLTGVVKISCGQGHNIAVKSDGTVAVWGATGSGYVGGQLPVSINSNIVDAKPNFYSNESILLLKSGSNSTTTTTGEIKQYSACVMVGSTLRTIAQDFDSKGYTSSGTYDINSYMKSAGSLPATNNETDTINLKTIVPKDSWYRVIQKYPSNGTVVSWNEYTEQKQIIE